MTGIEAKRTSGFPSKQTVRMPPVARKTQWFFLQVIEPPASRSSQLILRRSALCFLPWARRHPNYRIGFWLARLFDRRHQETDEQRSNHIESRRSAGRAFAKMRSTASASGDPARNSSVSAIGATSGRASASVRKCCEWSSQRGRYRSVELRRTSRCQRSLSSGCWQFQARPSHGTSRRSRLRADTRG